MHSAVSVYQYVGLSDGRHKCHTKRHLEFENNMVSHMIFS